MDGVLRSINEIDSDITRYQHLLSIVSRSDPLRPPLLYDLAEGRQERFLLLNQREDFDKSICHLTESILLFPLRWPKSSPIFLTAFLSLASSLVFRSMMYNQPNDAVYAAKYLFHLRDQYNEISGIPRHWIAELLVTALKAKLETGNVMQNIREIAILSGELFTSGVDTTHIILVITDIVVTKIHPGVPDPPLDELIECLQVARKHIPALLEARLGGHFALAIALMNRYFKTFVNDDYEEAMSILDEIIASNFPGDCQDESIVAAQAFSSVLAEFRAAAYKTPEYLEEAIYCTRALRNSYSVKEHSFHSFDPEFTAGQRFSFFGSIEGFEASSDNVNSFWHADLKSRVKDLAKEGDGMGGYFRIADELETLLLWIHNNDDTTKIGEAIEKGRALLAPYSPTDLPQAALFYKFGRVLFEAFWRTKKIDYLNETISSFRQAIACPFSQPVNHFALAPQSLSLFTRSQFFPGYRAQDLDEALELLSQYVHSAHVSLPDRYQCACLWAHTARYTRHASISTAYKSALSLVQNVPLFSPTLQLQHTTLATRNVTYSMSLDYVSYQVELHQLEEAIETLESGRALLWSEMRHLRTSIDQLLEADPGLGRKYVAVNRDLEELTTSIPPSPGLSMDDGTADGLRAVDPFGRLLLKHREILKERDKLISQIQALPGFASFLKSPPFDTLRSAASSGPVVIINHSEWRSDILILLHSTPPSLIPTPLDFYKRACALKDKLFDSRDRHGLDSKAYNETLASVLTELYILVGKPVIDRLRQLQVPEQSRVWWCPTSVFCSLPLHAMGPIPSDDGEMRYFLDLFICSYTPSLSALIQSRSRDPSSQSSDRPSILLVAQLDPSLPTVGGEIQVVQALDIEVTSLISAAATPAIVIEGFHHHRFVHFACHGTLEPSKPFEAGFELFGDERLTLLEIVRANLPTAEFAFLSACHTAEVTEGSIMDEGLHLAAAVQYCGFRSVVGTMWAMVDEDGRDLAENFYKALFSNSRRDQRIPLYERSAKALWFAVKKLRRKRRITLERWVNFVHYGA
ncbi:CHAT domain-containing protein [Lactarius quietus]|nr:CHAT domain-containing protein [Lactarius quietus]